MLKKVKNVKRSNKKDIPLGIPLVPVGGARNGVLRSDAEEAVRTLLLFIGEDPERGGLLETPERYVKALEEYAQGYTITPESVLKAFEDGGERYNEMVLVRDIPVHSLCEHHLAPFHGVAHIAYIPDRKILGLSKLSRLADVFARRLQVQERLTDQVADTLNTHLKPKGVAVVFSCKHMCMECRGVRKIGAKTITSALRGAFRENAAARAEFFSLINGKQ